MTTQVGTFVIFGDIEQKWLAFGGLSGLLGQPTSNEAPTFDGVGREQKFQGGFISWHPDAAVKAHVVWGLIGTRWAAIGREQFGYPVSDELDFPGGGKYNTFRAMQLAGHPDASIVWKPGTASAWEVYGAIRDKWISMGSVSGALGYPVQEEKPADDGEGRYQLFEHGSISWHPETGATPSVISLDSGPVVTDEPLGGWVKVVMNNKGDFTFTGHMHNSGATIIEYVANVVVITPSGIAYTLQHSGRTEGTVAGLPFGTPDRDDDWATPGNNPHIRDNWKQVSQARLLVRVDAHDKTLGGIQALLEEGLKELGKAAVTALIALI